MSQSSTLYSGLDVHQEAIAVAFVAQDHGAEVTYLGTIGMRQCDLDQLIRTLQSKAKPLVFVYEAGPCGDWLYRDLTPQRLSVLGRGPVLDSETRGRPRAHRPP